MVLDYKVQDCMVPLGLQALEAQEAHGGLGHHGAHGVQEALKDLLGPTKKHNTKIQRPNNLLFLPLYKVYFTFSFPQRCKNYLVALLTCKIPIKLFRVTNNANQYTFFSFPFLS